MPHPCSRAVCRHCGSRVGLFGLDGFGLSRRKHERLCSVRFSQNTASETNQAIGDCTTSISEDRGSFVQGTEKLCQSSSATQTGALFDIGAGESCLPSHSSWSLDDESFSVDNVGIDLSHDAPRNSDLESLYDSDWATVQTELPIVSDLSSPVRNVVSLPPFSVRIIFDYASMQDLLHLCAAGHVTHQLKQLAWHLIGIFQMARQDGYISLRPDAIQNYRVEGENLETLEQTTNEELQASYSKQRYSIKCLVEGVVRWRQYAPQRLMRLVQHVADDLLKPEIQLVSAKLCEGFATWGDGHVRNCIAKRVLMLLKVPAYRNLALDLFRLCYYDLGRFQNETVNELLPGILRQGEDDLCVLQSILAHTSSPGKSHPQVWVGLNNLLFAQDRQRKLPRYFRSRARDLWILLGRTWSRSAKAVDSEKYYAYRSPWLLSTRGEAMKYCAFVRARWVTECPSVRSYLNKRPLPGYPLPPPGSPLPPLP